MDNIEIIENPPEDWVENLRHGCKVWLVKENKVAEIIFPFEPPEPGYRSGYIGLKDIHIDRWHIDSNGRGFDGLPLMKPIKGHLPENPMKLPNTDIRHIHYELDSINKRLRSLEAIIHIFIEPLTITEFLYGSIKRTINGIISE